MNYTAVLHTDHHHHYHLQARGSNAWGWSGAYTGPVVTKTDNRHYHADTIPDDPGYGPECRCKEEG